MPVTLVAPLSGSSVENMVEQRQSFAACGLKRQLHIGLVNNMPDAALAATSRQFLRLLERGAGELEVVVSLWTLESIPRSPDTKREMASLYRAACGLRAASLDALIVTGAEPRAARLEDEPYWCELTELLDWAGTSTLSLVASCLAAHAATQHHGGIRRRRLAEKRSGIFSTRVVGRHPLTRGMPAVSAVPHSRLHDLDEDLLVEKGYKILRRSRQAGVDLFIKEGQHLQLFLQGHPEYEADTLAREYRRDLTRAIRGECSAPALPTRYFSDEIEQNLRDYAKRALVDPQAMPYPSQAMKGTEETWLESSTILFRNWLEFLATRKWSLTFSSHAESCSGG